MEAFIPIFGMLLIAALVVRRRLASGVPIVWTWRLVGLVTLGVLGTVAIPIGVAMALQYR